MEIEKIMTTYDTHVAGEAFRIILQSPLDFNDPKITDIYHESLKLLINEPRGHQGMNVCVITHSEIADFGLLFINHEHIPLKFGGLFAAVTVLLETGYLRIRDSKIYSIETMLGIFKIQATMKGKQGSFCSIESDTFLLEKNAEDCLINIDGSMDIRIFTLPEYIPEISLPYINELKNWGYEITKSNNNHLLKFTLVQRVNRTVVQTITFGPSGTIIRSPGIDTTVAVAMLNKLNMDCLEPLTNFSIYNHSLTAELIGGSNDRFRITSQCFITGKHQFVYDSSDPFVNGFLIQS